MFGGVSSRRGCSLQNSLARQIAVPGVYLKYMYTATANKTTARIQREESLIPVFFAICRFSSEKSSLLQLLGGLHHVVWPAEITPIILVGTKSEKFFSLGSESQIGRDDGKNTVFPHDREQARRNDVDAAKSQRLQLRG